MRGMYGVSVLILVVFGIMASGCLGGDNSRLVAPSVGYNDVDYGFAFKSGGQSVPQYKGGTTDELNAMVEEVEKDGEVRDVGEVKDVGESVFRKVITTADLSLEVDDASDILDEIINITQNAGGFVSRSSLYNNNYGESTGKAGYVTIRIPQSGFTSVMDKIGTLGSVTSKSISGRDVTEEFIDLSARLENLERHELRLLEILNMTTTVDEVLDVERELGRIRGDIESLTGRLNYLNDQVGLSTINVHVSEPRPIAHSWGLRDALLNSVNGFISTVNGLIVFIGYALPVVVFVTVSGFVIIFIRNRVRR
ncbi:MAG: DUF4349 domain-containing protein [Methanosarcinaceae archaeon]